MATVQAGFAAIAAVFLVVVLAALGAFMLSLSNTQQVTSAQDTLGSRAYWAARAGLEWAIVAVPATPAICPNATPTPIITTIGPSTIEGFAINIYCSLNVYSEGGVNRTIFRFESQASMGSGAGQVGFVERSVSAAVETP